MKTITTFFCLILIFINGCKTTDMIFHPDDFVKRDSPRQFVYIHDTITIYNDQGEITSVLKGVPVNKKLVFTSVGESYTFKSGEAIEVIMDGIDFSVASFDIITDDNTEDITLKLVDKAFTKVKLESKCQTIVRTGIDYVPKIEIAQGLKPEQIVVTPIFDDSCYTIGYQIRYGSTERGCRKEAKEVLTRFKKCVEGKIYNGKRDNKKDPCRIKRKLGIPCP